MDNAEEDSESSTTDAMGATLFRQLIDMFVQPEVERRRAEGRLHDGFVLSAAQVICSADGKPNEIRLNEEVQALALARRHQDANWEVGESVYLHQIERVEAIVLPDTEDPNCGHATLVRLGAHWHVAFDFRYNRGRSEILLSRAREFLDAATAAHAKQAWSAFAYNLYTAIELAAKAKLALTGNSSVLGSTSHKNVKSGINRDRKLGNVDHAHCSALNALFDLRQSAAYSPETFSMPPEQASALLVDVGEFVERVAAGLGRGAPGAGSAR